MRFELEPLLARGSGLLTRERALTVLSEHQLDDEIRRGHLTALFRSVYCRPWDADDPALLPRAALLSVRRGAVSHLTALAAQGLLMDGGAPVHVLVTHSRRLKPSERLVVHRHRGRFPAVTRAGGLVTVTAAVALVQSWRLLPTEERRATLIDGVRGRQVSTGDIRTHLAGARNAPGRAEILDLCHLLDAGCESELEIYGYREVFDVPGLRHAKRQHWVCVNGEWFRLDMAFEAEKVAVELDGTAGHAGDTGRQRDTRRDALLATVGWLTVRYTRRRLHGAPESCRSELLAILALRSGSATG